VLVVLACSSIASCGPDKGPVQRTETVASSARNASLTASVDVERPVAALQGVPHSVATLARDAEGLAERQSAACLAHSAADSSARSIAVHRWTDAAGITHYSDQPPATATHDHRLIEVRGLPPIVVQASGEDVELPGQLQQRAVADALGVQRVLRDVLGVGAPAGLTLHVVFVRSAQTYARLIGEPSLASSAGAYSTASRTIHVRMQAQEEASFAVLRHEITHALVHESIGNLPTPINEGLAEYFGRYRIAGMGGQVDVGADRVSLMGAAPAVGEDDALVDLLASDGAAFYVDEPGPSGRERRYLRAYALIVLLMKGPPERAALAAVLARQRVDPCTPVLAERILDEHYKGGLRVLATDWAALMRNPPHGIEAY